MHRIYFLPWTCQESVVNVVGWALSIPTPREPPEASVYLILSPWTFGQKQPTIHKLNKPCAYIYATQCRWLDVQQIPSHKWCIVKEVTPKCHPSSFIVMAKSTKKFWTFQFHVPILLRLVLSWDMNSWLFPLSNQSDSCSLMSHMLSGNLFRI